MGFQQSGYNRGIGISATINKLKQQCGYVRDERLVISNPHSS